MDKIAYGLLAAPVLMVAIAIGAAICRYVHG